MSERPRILFVDDEERVLDSIRRHFLDEAYDLSTATSGKEGLAMLESLDADVVISDFRMPEMNGGEFLREVCQRWPETIRLVLSGYADISAVISAINDGAIFKFVTKPWHENELKDAVSEAVEKRRSSERMRALAELALKANQALFADEGESAMNVRRRNLELEERVAALGLLENVFQSSSAGIVVFDGAGKVLEANPVGRQLFLTTASGGELTDLRLPAELLSDLEQVLSSGALVTGRYAVASGGAAYLAKLAPLCHAPGVAGAVAVIVAAE